MLLVKTRKGKSTVHGTGPFAEQFIPKGTIIWRYVAGHDAILAREQYEGLGREEKEGWQRFAYVSRFTGLLVCSGDAYVFMNHSHRPNVGVSPRFEPPEGVDVALCDINPGDELLFDYTWFGEDPCCCPEHGRLPEDIDVVFRSLPTVAAR